MRLRFNSEVQLTREQRYQIKAPLKTGHNLKEIAEVINVHQSTISRELRRNPIARNRIHWKHCGHTGFQHSLKKRSTMNCEDGSLRGYGAF